MPQGDRTPAPTTIAERQQDVEHAAGQIDPEVADGLRRTPGEAADQRDGQRDAGRRRDEVVHRQAGHLREIAHRRLAARSDCQLVLVTKLTAVLNDEIWRHRGHAPAD